MMAMDWTSSTYMHLPGEEVCLAGMVGVCKCRERPGEELVEG